MSLLVSMPPKTSDFIPKSVFVHYFITRHPFIPPPSEAQLNSVGQREPETYGLHNNNAIFYYFYISPFPIPIFRLLGVSCPTVFFVGCKSYVYQVWLKLLRAIQSFGFILLVTASHLRF